MISVACIIWHQWCAIRSSRITLTDRPCMLALLVLEWSMLVTNCLLGPVMISVACIIWHQWCAIRSSRITLTDRPSMLVLLVLEWSMLVPNVCWVQWWFLLHVLSDISDVQSEALELPWQTVLACLHCWCLNEACWLRSVWISRMRNSYCLHDLCVGGGWRPECPHGCKFL